MYLQSIKSIKNNAAKSVNRSILKKSRHIGFGVFRVHSSMVSNISQGTVGYIKHITNRERSYKPLHKKVGGGGGGIISQI